MNYEFNLLHHVGVVAKRVRAAAAAAETAAHEGDNTPSGPTGRGVKSGFWSAQKAYSIQMLNTE